MNGKLISADRLIQFVENWGKHHGREEAADSFLYAIHNAPAVDAVEVVRCYKCKHWEPMNKGSWMPLPEPPKPKAKTYKDVFFAAFPNAPLDYVYEGIPKACINDIFSNQKAICSHCDACWNQPYPEEEGCAE